MAYYVLDENKNKVEAYDKEGVLALLEQAIEDGDLSHIEADSAFVSKIKSLINGTTHHIEFVTQAQFNQLENDDELVPNTYYFITDDTTAEDLEDAVNGILDGTTRVPKATDAENAEYAENVTEKINGKNLTDIFESNGTTVKNATKIQNIDLSDNTTASFGSFIIAKKRKIGEVSGNTITLTDFVINNNKKYEAVVTISENGYNANFSFIGISITGLTGSSDLRINFSANVGKFQVPFLSTGLNFVDLSCTGTVQSNTTTLQFSASRYYMSGQTLNVASATISAITLYEIIE
jgi:hypothetical protein